MSGRIEGIVARLHGLHPRLIDLSLDRPDGRQSMVSKRLGGLNERRCSVE